MNQTSVEWLQAEFNKWAEGKVFIPQDLLEEAKRLEKEQIIKAVEDTRGNIVPRMFISENLSGEQYYNQTYNN
jgi:hypothetical protein